MRVIEPGHIYALAHLDDSPYNVTTLEFVKRVGPKYPHNEGEPHPGTHSQEVLRALIDRQQYVQMQQSWHENVIVVQNLRQALWMLEARAKHTRGEFLQRSVMEIERVPTCSTCGHLDCTKH